MNKKRLLNPQHIFNVEKKNNKIENSKNALHEVALQAEAFDVAKQIALTLREAGYEAYLVGGSVRDLVLGETPQEHDIVTSAPPSKVRSLFHKTIPLGERFGVILVLEGEHFFEVASYRTEGDYIDGRRPSQVSLSHSAEEDVLRRDFTMNGLLMDPLTGEIIDYVDGRRDIEQRIIRAIGNPDERFSEDHLRMLRAVRFSANLGFTIDPDTFMAIAKNAPLIKYISAERVRDELTKILTRGDSRRGMALLAETGLLAFILPEVNKMQHVSQPHLFHPEGDVWEHTLRMLHLLSEMNSALRSNVRLAWGILLHDVGKPETRFQDHTGIHFYGHARVGEHIAEKIMRRLRFSRSDVDAVTSLIHHHMQFMNVMEMRPNHLIRFLRMPNFRLHLELHRLDCLASHGDLGTYDFCNAKLSEKPSEALHPAPLINGEDLIACGFEPGPLFGEILHAVESAQLDGELTSKSEAVAFVFDKWGDRIKSRID